MSTTTVSSGTTSVGSSTSSGYLVDGSGTLAVMSGGIISGLITISGNGVVHLSSSGRSRSATRRSPQPQPNQPR
jgi:hypothetical protein